MKKGDEASPSISLAGRALLVKMLITLVPHGIFCSNFVYLCILTMSSHWYEKRGQCFTEHHFGQSSSFLERLITLESPYAFGSIFEYFFFLFFLSFLFFSIFLPFLFFVLFNFSSSFFLLFFFFFSFFLFFLLHFLNTYVV